MVGVCHVWQVDIKANEHKCQDETKKGKLTEWKEDCVITYSVHEAETAAQKRQEGYDVWDRITKFKLK